MYQPHFWYTGDLNTEEITLKNNTLLKSEVSQIDLCIKSISAIDSEGQEHNIFKSPGETPVQIKSMSSGEFIRTRCLSKLAKGTYSTLRIYAANDTSKLVSNTRETKCVENKKYYDFEIKDTLVIKSNRDCEFKLWFELTPFQAKPSLIKPFLDLFKKTDRLVHRLAGVYGK
ncbi:hypothetical protein GCM10022260_00730 [Gaetbulibacter aestuarii]